MATKKNPSFRSATPRRVSKPTRRANGGSPWSRTEIAFLRKNYRNNPTSWCAKQLGRTAYAVRYKASDLSIKKANPSVWRASGKSTGTFGFTPKTTWGRPTSRKSASRSTSRRAPRSRR